jgi:hypothetical protein
MARPKTKTNAQIKNDYAKKAYDDVRLQVKKGNKAIIAEHAASRGESLGGFINRAIDETMQRDRIATGDMKGVSENAGI